MHRSWQRLNNKDTTEANESIFENHPIEKASMISKFLFNWMNPLTAFGQKNRIKIQNLGPILEDLRSEHQLLLFRKYFDEYEMLNGVNKWNKHYNIFKTILKAHKYEIQLSLAYNFIHTAFKMLCPILIMLIVNYIQAPQGSDGGLIYGLALVFCYISVDIIGTITEEQACYLQMIFGTKVRNALIAMIYQKALKISNATNKKFTQGEIINFMQIDSEKIIDICWVIPQVAKLPIALLFTCCLLFYFFGISLFGGIIIGAIVLIINYLLAIWNSKIQQKILNK